MAMKLRERVLPIDERRRLKADGTVIDMTARDSAALEATLQFIADKVEGLPVDLSDLIITLKCQREAVEKGDDPSAFITLRITNE
jgi:hypothetical protein